MKARREQKEKKKEGKTCLSGRKKKSTLGYSEVTQLYNIE
jgi:hypothetical protein